MENPLMAEKAAGDNLKFCVKDFRKSLTKDKGIVKPLLEFIQYARGPSGKQIVMAFLQDSAAMDSPEFIDLIAEKRPMNELATIFEALEVIFLRIADDLQMFEIWAMNMIKQLLDSKNIRCIYQGLKLSNTSSQIKSTLNFLTSMVTVSTKAAKEVASRFNFKGEVLMPLLLKTNIKDAADVRLCLIHFLMSFLMTGDHTLITKIIEQKGVLNNVFPGLSNDKVTTIEAFLSALKSQVVENSLMLKTAKIRLLNNYTLGFVFKLFKWRGTSTYSKKKKLETKLTAAEIEGIAALISSENANIVHQLAHEFLVAVCCSSKNGIIFLDNTYGSSGSNANHIITELLKSVEKPYEDPLMEETILQILKACPDQMNFYFPCFQKAYDPRPSVPWQKSMAFLIKVLQSHDVNKILDSVDQETSANKLVSILLNVIATSVFKHDNLESAIKHSDFRVRDFGLRYTEVVLQQVNVALTSPCLKRILYNNEELRSFHENFMTSLQMLLPSFGSLQQCWELVTTNMEKITEADIGFLDSSALYNHLKLLISTLNTYIHLFQKASVDKETDWLLEGLGRLQNHLDKNEYLEIQTLIFSLLSESSLASSLLIRKVNEKSVALILCETIWYLSDSPSQQVAEHLMKKLLIATKLFSSMENEIDIWINSFLQSDKASLSMVSFFNDAIIDLISNSQTYFDKTKDYILQALGSSADKEAENFDKIFDDIICNDIEDISMLCSSVGAVCSLSNNMNFHYSPLVLVTLEHLENLPANDREIGKSLSSVLVNMLHVSSQPTVLAHLLRHHLHILPDNIRNVLNYLSGEKIETTRLTDKKMRRTLNKCATIGDYARAMFETKELPVDGAANAIFTKLFSIASFEDICIAVQQILTYLNLLLTKENEDELKELISVFCDMVMLMLTADPVVKVDGQSQACQILKDSPTARPLDKLCGIILSHPVIQEMFLHKRLTHMVKDECAALWHLTRLTLLAMKKLGSCDQVANYPLLFSERISGFILQMLSLLQSGRITNIKLPIPLVEIIDPILILSNLKTACSILDLLIQLTATKLMLRKKCKLNQAGQLLIYMLHFIVNITPKLNRPILNARRCTRCAEIYVEIRNYHMKYGNPVEHENASSVFGNIFLRILETSALNSAIISQDIFRFCLYDVNSEISLQLATTLIPHNLHNVHLLEELFWNNKETEMDVSKYVSLAMALLCGLNNTYGTQHSESCQRFLRKLFKLYWPLMLSSIFESKDSDQLYQLDVNSASNLVSLFSVLNVTGVDEMVSFAEKCFQHCSLQKPIPKVVFESAKDLFLKLSSTECMVASLNPITVFASLLLKSILALSKNASEDNLDNLEKQWMIQVAIDFLGENDSFPNLGKVLHSEKCWHHFIKIMLKDGLRDECGSDMLHLLKVVIYQLKQNSELLRLQVTTIFDLVLGHSNFLPGLLNVSTKYMAWRETLVDLLTFLVNTEQSVCNKTHIPIYLAAYRATLSSIDQKLLLLMFLYEQYEVDFYSFKPFVWGETAIDHYSLLRSKTQSLWAELSTKEYLSLFDKKKLLKTALNFPLELTLKLENTGGQNCFITNEPSKELYDPRFVVLSFATLLSPESLVHCKHFIKCNGLGFVFAALGSKCKNMRAIAYHVLHDLYEHLEGTKIHIRLPWTSLLDCIRNSMSRQNLQLPNILTVFLVKASQLLLHPADSIAKPIVSYLFIKPELDLWNIPDFYQLFSHPDLMHQFSYRNWLLSTICEGLRTSDDYRICQKRYAFKIILSFYKSPLASSCIKLQILQVVKAAVKIYPVLTDLIQKQGLLGSLHAALRNCNEKIFLEVMNIVELAWTTLSKANQELLSSVIVSEFILILLAMLENVSSTTSPTVFKKYISVCASVLRWITKKEKSKAASVCLPTTFIIKIIHLHVPLVEEGNSNKIISYQKESDSIHAQIEQGHNSDINDASRMNVDAIDNGRMKLYQDILDILLCWEPYLMSNETTRLRSLNNAEHTSQVFRTACNLLLKLVCPISSNLRNVTRVYSWINACLQSDTSNMLTQALLWPSKSSTFCDIFAPLFKAYEFLLTVSSKDSSQMHFITSEDNDKKCDAVLQISKVLVTVILKIVSRNGVFASLTTLGDFEEDSFVKLLFSENVREVFNIPEVRSLTVVLNGAETGDLNSYEAAVSIAMIAYRLWHQVDEVQHFVELIGSFKMNACQAFSTDKSKAKKRKSLSKEEKRKRKRICL